MELKNKLDEMTELTERFSKMNSSDFIKSIKTKNVSMFMTEKYNNPSLTKKEICKKIGISLPVLNQSLRDLSYSEFIRKRTKNPNPNPNLKKNKNSLIDYKGGSNMKEIQDEIQQRINTIVENKFSE